MRGYKNRDGFLQLFGPITLGGYTQPIFYRSVAA